MHVLLWLLLLCDSLQFIAHQINRVNGTFVLSSFAYYTYVILHRVIKYFGASTNAHRIYTVLNYVQMCAFIHFFSFWYFFFLSEEIMGILNKLNDFFCSENKIFLNYTSYSLCIKDGTLFNCSSWYWFSWTDFPPFLRTSTAELFSFFELINLCCPSKNIL